METPWSVRGDGPARAEEVRGRLKRFVVVQEPTGTWAVFDTLDDTPVVLCGKAQIGLNLTEAKVVAAMENEGTDQRNDSIGAARRL